ncbi:MAG: SRPBCC domain-containing protein [Solirubrobacterales bacterium]|nr:SRPBCC domain-containing protein [Solirubrobacterales bacterium]
MADRIERELVLPAPPDEVWSTVTGPGWLADEVELELVVGGEARFSSEDEIRTGWIEEVAAPDDVERSGRLVFWWSGDGEPASRVELWLDPEGDSDTRLRVLEERPLEVLDLVGIPLPGTGESSHGPALLSLA